MRRLGISEQGRKRVLIVDDDLDSAELLQELLQGEGHEVAIAHDGTGAIALATALHPEVVLLDIHLGSSMDGYDVCRHLGAALDRPKRIVAMTGPAALDDLRFREAGFDAHIAKPILDTKRILSLLQG